MFDFLKRSRPAIKDFGFLKTDMHAHWLPGLDDGAKTMEDSLTLIRGLKDMGYRRLIATPHVMADLYPNSSSVIKSTLERVKLAVSQAKIDIELSTAAEYLIDEGFPDLIESNDLLTLPGKHILVEFSFVSPPHSRDQILFKLQSKGYKVILAHPERYRYYHDRPEEFAKLHKRGVLLQINLLSLSGYYGRSVQKAALALVKDGMATILGTDAHHIKHLDQLRNLLDSQRQVAPIVKHQWSNAELFN